MRFPLAILILALLYAHAAMLTHVHAQAIGGGWAVAPMPLPLAAAPLPSGVPFGLAYPVPSPTNPLASVVAINTGAPLLSVASSAPAAGLGQPIMQLLNQESNSLKHAIAIQIIATGMDSIDALAVSELPQGNQGHFHCRLDAESVVASASPRIDYHEVASGAHQVACWTVDNAHRAMSDAQIANVHIA